MDILKEYTYKGHRISLTYSGWFVIDGFRHKCDTLKGAKNYINLYLV